MIYEIAPSYESLKADIGVCLNNAANDFFRIGYYLRQIKERQLFLDDGYHNIWEFAKEEYGLSMSSASRFMSINARFSINDGKEMDPKYIEMGSSKLQEMLGLPDEELEKVTQATPVREVRRIVSQVKNIETLAKQCEATGSCPDENTSCIAGEKVGTDEGKELCLKCWRGFLKTHPDWKPGIRMEKLLEKNAKGITCNPAEEDSGAGNTEPDEKTEKEIERDVDRQQEHSKPARPEPSRKDIKAFYDWIRSWISAQPESRIDAVELKSRYRNACGGGSGFQYDGSARGVTINGKKEITWNEAAKRLREIQEEERKSGGCAEVSEAEKQETARRLEKDRRLLDFYRAVYPGTRQIISERNRDAITKELRAVYGNTYENGEGWSCYPDKIVFRDKPGAEQVQIPWGRFAAELAECLDRFPEIEKSILSEGNGQKAPEVVDADFKEIDDAEVSEQSSPEKAEKQCYSFGDVERLLQRNKAALEDCINFMQGDDDPPPVFRMSHIYVDALELLLREMKKNMDEDMEEGGL